MNIFEFSYLLCKKQCESERGLRRHILIYRGALEWALHLNPDLYGTRFSPNEKNRSPSGLNDGGLWVQQTGGTNAETVDSKFNSEIIPPLIADNIMQWDDPPELISIVKETDSMKVNESIPLNEPVKIPISHKSSLKESLPISTDPL